MEFERRSIFSEAKEIVFLFYLDASATDLNGVSIIVKNVLKNYEIVNRLLKNKCHINGGDVTTTPRAELQAAHLCSRLYALLQDQLREFLLVFGGKVKFEILSDSEIVLNQIGCLPYMFKPWVGARIQETNIDEKVVFMHVPTADIQADILTRAYYGPPASLPWVGHSVQLVQKNNKQVKHINVTNLPESNTREIPNKQCTSVLLTLNSASRQLGSTDHSQSTGLPLSGTLPVTRQYPIPDLR